ncbi:MAG: P-loop NTPase [Candidatus Aenigmarchaeota archaeon]|nr:P-loop NTPase [Candidatus Aenigmarchaeota archaeon]
MTRVIGIISGKGGVGKSTVAANLALALRKFKKNVLLIDCNLSTPHLSYYLGATDYKSTINDVLLGKTDINTSLYPYNGINYLPASVKFEDLVGVEVTKFKKDLLKLKKNLDFVILDAAPGLGKEALFVMDASKEIIFVTTPFVPMVGDIIRCKEVLGQLGEKKMGLVLNMVTHDTHELKSEVIEEITGVPVMGEIFYDKNVVHSMVMRAPILQYRPKSMASVGFMKMAALLSEVNYETPMRMKLHKLLRTIRNVVVPSPVIMPQSTEEVKKDFLSNF